MGIITNGTLPFGVEGGSSIITVTSKARIQMDFTFSKADK